METLDPVTGPYLDVAHGNPDYAEWIRYAVELKLREAADTEDKAGVPLIQRDNREVIVAPICS